MRRELRIATLLGLLPIAPAAWAQGTALAPATRSPGFLDQQQADEILAGRLIGTTVYNGTDEALGEVGDVLLTADGRLKGVVVAVGGFLGLAERNVAVPWQRLEVSRDQDQDLVLRLEVDRVQLENAPAFKTVAPRAAAQQAEQPAPASSFGASQGAVVPAPVPAVPPANPAQ